MPRPIQIITPLPFTIASGLGGAANTNLLPVVASSNSMSSNLNGIQPAFAQTQEIGYYDDPAISATQAVNAAPVVSYGKDVRLLNRNITITSVANLSAQTITLVGRDVLGQPFSQTLTAPAAAASVSTTIQVASLDSFSCNGVSAAGNFTLSVGLTLSICPIRLNYYLPNTSWSVSGIVSGTGVSYNIEGTIQKAILYTNSSKPYVNPNIFWQAVDASLTGATTNINFFSQKQYSYLRANATLTDNTSAFSFTLLQQGLRS